MKTLEAIRRARRGQLSNDDFDALPERVQDFLTSRVEDRAWPPPRYDAIFFDGTAMLDAIARGES